MGDSSGCQPEQSTCFLYRLELKDWNYETAAAFTTSEPVMYGLLLTSGRAKTLKSGLNPYFFRAVSLADTKHRKWSGAACKQGCRIRSCERVQDRVSWIRKLFKYFLKLRNLFMFLDKHQRFATGPFLVCINNLWISETRNVFNCLCPTQKSRRNINTSPIVHPRKIACRC